MHRWPVLYFLRQLRLTALSDHGAGQVHSDTRQPALTFGHHCNGTHAVLTGKRRGTVTERQVMAADDGARRRHVLRGRETTEAARNRCRSGAAHVTRLFVCHSRYDAAAGRQCAGRF